MPDRNFRIGSTALLPILLACLVCIPGCTSPAVPGSGPSGSAVDGTPMQTLAQPEDSAVLIRMPGDIYTAGDVVEFVVTNIRSSPVSCSGDPSAFSVRYQDGSGRWITRLGDEIPSGGNETVLDPGASAPPAKFITTGWAPGRYRIVSTCGVSREILLRSPVHAGPTVTSCPEITNETPYIRINAISSPRAGEEFTISGTTSLPAGTGLRYSIFALMPGTGNVTSAKLVSSTFDVSEGSCGTNTWSVTGRIQVPGNYFIGISNTANTVSAVKRFSVLEKEQATTTSSLPPTTKVPGITTGSA